MVGSRFFIINRITRQSLQGLVMNMNKLFIPLLLVTVFLAVSCSDDEPKDVVNEIKMSVSAETGTYIPWGSDTSVECMLVMSEDNPGVWEPLGFNSIKWFTYERGHEYYLSVERTILANPPMDGSDRTYSLLRILEDRIITEPEEPEDKEVSSEEDIEYYDKCPFNKYAMEKELLVDSEGNIRYIDGHQLPSYDKARIWIENILPKDDPNWVEFQKVPYMATYSFVLSPFTDESRLVRNDSSGPMFKEVIPENEFNLLMSMEPGEEARYALILANVYMDGLQKLEFSVKKQ